MKEDKETNENKVVFTYVNEGNFGELALLYNMPRAASVQVCQRFKSKIQKQLNLSKQATTDGSVWAMDRQTFRKIVLKSAFQKRKMYESFLENVRLLESLEVHLSLSETSFVQYY